MATKILSIGQVVVNEDIYPRVACNWQTSYDYLQSLKAGAVFPPITVAMLGGKYVLVDGRHRLEAFKKNGEEHIEAEILKGLTEKEAYVKAIKLNIIHGRQFSTQEKAMIALQLQDMKYETKDIAQIVQIPADKLTSFIAKRMANTLTGEQVILKAPIRHMAGETIDSSIDSEQRIFAAGSQFAVLEEFLALLENNWLNLKNKQVVKIVKEIKDRLNKLKLD